ncbi:MAG: glycosyltransferase family 4 protein [Woeseiaceae bacterium]|nr:glycosyltransferase family 4 protein [Woeseiaceae bacterium]
MKILYHHRIRSKDGQYVHVEELTNALLEAGHELVFVGPNAIDNEELGADAGFVAWMKQHLPQFVYEILEFGYAFLDFLRLANAIRAHKPDCIYERYNLFLPSGIWARKLFRLPLLLEVNAPLFAERSKYDGIALKRFAKATESYTWRGADYVLPVTEVLAKIVEDAGVPRDRIRVVPNGIRPDRFARVPAREKAKARLGLEGKFVLGFAGFVREWHGIDRVLEYLAESGTDDQHLLLVGDGPAKEQLLRKAQELGLAERFTITGIVDRDDIAAYLAAFDISLQPAVVAYASPLKLFEYLYLGCAIVAPATANIREILSDGDNALLFDPGSRKELFECIERCYRDEELRQRLGDAARDTIDQKGLTWARNATRVIDLFTSLGATTPVPDAQRGGE